MRRTILISALSSIVTVVLCVAVIAGATWYFTPLRVTRKLFVEAGGVPVEPYTDVCREPLFKGDEENRFDYDVTMREQAGEFLIVWRGCTRKFGYRPVTAHVLGGKLIVTLCLGTDSTVTYALEAENGRLKFVDAG